MANLHLLQQWFAQNHVAEWYRDEARMSYDEIVAKYAPAIRGEEPIHCFVITYDGRPIGQIQTYRVKDFPTYQDYLDVDDGTAGVDILIGDPAYVHKGLGAPILRGFLRAVVFGTYHATNCLIDPEAGNVVAIRSYVKAGFQHVRTVQLSADDPPVHLMRIDKAECEG